jgi:hypothetical protein
MQKNYITHTFLPTYGPDGGRPGWGKVVREVDMSRNGGYAFRGFPLSRGRPTKVKKGSVVIFKDMVGYRDGLYYAGIAKGTGFEIQTATVPESQFEAFKAIVAGMLGDARLAGVSVDLEPAMYPPISRERAVAIASESFLHHPLPYDWKDMSPPELYGFIRSSAIIPNEDLPFLKVWGLIQQTADRIEEVSRGIYETDYVEKII